jgi:uncharacterized membrane-anchored protein YhcB (DUF1043 family)
MDFLNLIDIKYILCFFLGAMTGGLFYKLSFGSKTRNKILQDKLDETKQQLQDYKKTINDHMTTSAQLFKNLSLSNQAIRQHFMHVFQDLCDDENVYYKLADSLQKKIIDKEYSADIPVENSYEQPKDYVPKKTDAESVLSEGFGLKKD